MLTKIKHALFGAAAGRDGKTAEADDLHLATAALLMEAALMDGAVGADEEATVAALLTERFALTPDQAARLLEAGRAKAENAVELYSMTREIKDTLPHEERVGMVEMLWEVAYADGVLHDYEANLLRRVCGLLYVSDQESGAARKAALRRMGLL